MAWLIRSKPAPPRSWLRRRFVDPLIRAAVGFACLGVALVGSLALVVAFSPADGVARSPAATSHRASHLEASSKDDRPSKDNSPKKSLSERIAAVLHPGQVRVKSYERADGTEVDAYWRSKPKPKSDN